MEDFMQTYLITGGAGFIGANLIAKLIPNNRIICIDNFNNYYNPEIKENNIKKFINNKNFKLYREDICNLEKIDTIFKENKPDYIIHLAAKAGVRDTSSPHLYANTNITGTINILETAKKYNIKKIIAASSSSVYGNKSGEKFTEDMKTDRPVSIYAATKIASENLCYAYSHLFNLKIICLRFFTVYGPMQRPDMAIHKFTKCISENQPLQIFGDGETARDYTYIDDIIEGIIKCIDYDTDFEIFNLGSGNVVKLNYLIKLLSEKMNKNAKITYNPLPKTDVLYTASDISKARKLLGYNPETQIEQGIEKFVNWFNNEKIY